MNQKKIEAILESLEQWVTHVSLNAHTGRVYPHQAKIIRRMHAETIMKILQEPEDVS